MDIKEGLNEKTRTNQKTSTTNELEQNRTPHGENGQIVSYSEEERRKVKEFFEKHSSPLADLSGIFTWTASRYNLPYNLLPAIVCVESSCGKRYIFSTNNIFGWRHGFERFDSLSDSIVYVGKAIAENRVYKEFQQQGSIESLGKIYAEDTNWANKVQHWMQVIEAID